MWKEKMKPWMKIMPPCRNKGIQGLEPGCMKSHVLAFG